MSETIAFYILIAGLLLLALGWLWLLVAAFRQGWGWGLAVFFIPPVALVFIAKHWGRAARPLFVLLLGLAVAGAPYGVNLYANRHRSLGPHEKLVDGELHVTLTGWDRGDYSPLQGRSEIVVLQMANPDVTDQTLQYLQGMNKLRVLDLSYSQVTDGGLVVLKDLPALQELRLKKTAITDQGFKDHIAPLATLQKLDVELDPQIKGATLRAWKQDKPDRLYLH